MILGIMKLFASPPISFHIFARTVFNQLNQNINCCKGIDIPYLLFSKQGIVYVISYCIGIQQ